MAIARISFLRFRPQSSPLLCSFQESVCCAQDGTGQAPAPASESDTDSNKSTNDDNE